MARAENVFGHVTAVGTTYTQVAAASGADWNLMVKLCNRVTTTIKVRVYRADSTWASGEPTAGTLKTAWVYDLSIPPGGVANLAGYMLLDTEKLIVRSDTASSLDVQADGVQIT